MSNLTKKMELISPVDVSEMETDTITAPTGQDLVLQGRTGKDIIIKLTDASASRSLQILDSADALVCKIDSNGVVTTAAGLAGPVTGAVTGNVTGDLTGDVTGDVTGQVTGAVVNAISTIDFANGHVDKTLSSTEKKSMIIKAIQADQAANIIAPAENRMYIVINTSGAAITIKKAAGTGVAVANNKTAIVAYTGSDYARVTADA